jgi:geranylgeranyl pyrophosphate synthase
MLALLSQLDGGARQVPDALSRAARHHERADECAKLAEAATDDRFREHYRQMAQNYLNRARSELARLEPDNGR